MKTVGDTSGDLPTFLFQNPKAWDVWLDRNYSSSPGIWLRLARKASGVKSVSYAEALEVALCYGWIDGQKKGESENAWLQKFTPRAKQSIWSKINREKALALIESGRMKTAGFNAIEHAKKDGRWEAAYDSQSAAAVPVDLQAALDKNARAKSFFATLDSHNRYAVLFRIHTAKKAETRAKRIQKFVEMLEKHEKLHP
ncbi:MAG: YdeI/OmpD-associated family protein [Bryobacteraceae bacterium]